MAGLEISVMGILHLNSKQMHGPKVLNIGSIIVPSPARGDCFGKRQSFFVSVSG